MPRLLILYPSRMVVCGVGTWLEMLSDELNARGWDVTVGLAWGRRFHDPLQIERVRPRLRTIRIDGRGGTPYDRVEAVRGAIRHVQPDVVLVTLLQDFLLGALQERQSGGVFRVAMAIHGNDAAHVAACSEYADRLDLVTCVNRSCETALVTLLEGNCGGRLHRVANGVSPPIVAVERDPSVLTIGLVGRMHPGKRICDLEPTLAALAGNIPWRLIVAGQGSEQTSVQRLAARHSQGKVEVLGAVPRAELYERVYPRLDVLLSFSPSEGWPLAIAEAMAHGVVPVCAEFTGIHAEGVIRHEQTGLIFPIGGIADAAAELERLWSNVRLRQRVSRQAAREIVDEYSPSRFGGEWDRILRSCLERPAISAESRTMGPGRDALWRRLTRRAKRMARWTADFDTARREWPTLSAEESTILAADLELRDTHARRSPSWSPGFNSRVGAVPQSSCEGS